MPIQIDFSKLKTSWTKFDIVQVLEVISNIDLIESYKAKEIVIDEPILRSFLGIKTLKDPTPSFWIDIQNYPNEKKLFALFAVLFTHGDIIKLFANEYSNHEMGGVFVVDDGKMYTNIRSALVESGAALSNYRRSDEVPYDFTSIFKNGEVGKLFKNLLTERICRLTGNSHLNDSDFYSICYDNKFHSAVGLTFDQFQLWLNGTAISTTNKGNYVQNVSINDFYSVKEADLRFGNSKEIYFLGENGDGKSLILMAIYLTFKINFINRLNNIEKVAKVIDIIKENPYFFPLGMDDSGREYGIGNDSFLDNIYAYGTHRGRYDTDDAEEFGFMSLFDSEQKLINPVSWLKDQKLLEFEKSLDENNGIGEIKELPNSFPSSWLEEMFFDLLEKHVEIKIEGTGIFFKEKNAVLTFDQLSEGYKSILIFVSDLMYRLNKNAIEGQSIKDLKGIVLVDEIDLHLHPKWQRVIIGKLRTIFPNVQFIFTTHSPTIIQGASEDAIIYRVYRNSEDGKTRISEPYYRKDLNHLMINTLLTSPLFGLENSRLDSENNFANTSDTYLIYRINEKLDEELTKQKTAGKEFISDNQIDELIKKVIDEELRRNDQD